MPERWIQLMRKSTFIPKSTSCWAAIYCSNRAWSTTSAQPVVEHTSQKKGANERVASQLKLWCHLIKPSTSSLSVNRFSVSGHEHIIHSQCRALVLFFSSRRGLWSPVIYTLQVLILARPCNWSKKLTDWCRGTLLHGWSDLDLYLGGRFSNHFPQFLGLHCGDSGVES